MPAATNAIRNGPSLAKRIVTFSLLLLFAVLLIALFFGTIFSTSVAGTEFSPSTFQLRTFSYRRFPGTKYRLSKTNLGNANAVVDKTILRHLTASTATLKWDVVEVTEGALTNTRPPALLTKLLSAQGPEGRLYWEQWSEEHEDLASVLWPLVQKAALQDLYGALPSMLETAIDASSPIELRHSCLKIIADEALLNSQKQPPVFPTQG